MLSLSSPRLVTLAALALSFGLAACSAKNPNFCEGADCDAIDAAIDAAPVTCTATGADPSCPAATPVCVSGACTGMCAADTDCAGRPAGQGVCLMATGACVACDEDDVQAMPGSAEDECPAANQAVCDGDTHTCRACEAHSECASGVCDAGRCAPAAEIVYMATNGADGGNCGTLAAPCLTLNNAIDKLQMDAALKYILMAPSATSYAARNNADRADFEAVTAHVVGYGASVLRNGPGEILDIRSGSTVTIEGLTVANATATASGIGIKIDSSTVRLFQVRVEDNSGIGINVSGATSSLRVVRSTISGNDDGGIVQTAGAFTIVNNMIANNGDSQSNVGGLSVTSDLGTNALEFNTIIDNNAQLGLADGLICSNSALAARNNIINGDTGQLRVSGNCTHHNTLYGPDGSIAGASNVVVAARADYKFVGVGDFHLDPTANPASVARGAADATNLTGEELFDFDGEPRVSGGSVDVGADEIP